MNYLNFKPAKERHMAKAIPDGYEGITPYLIVPNYTESFEVYKKAFDAEEVMRMPGPDGISTMHAEIKVFGSHIMLTDENPAWDAKSPKTLNGTPVSLHIYVEDVDAAFQKALDAGFTEACPLMDAFWGDRFGKLKDPFGHEWSLATHKVDLTIEEMQKAGEEFMKNMC